MEKKNEMKFTNVKITEHHKAVITAKINTENPKHFTGCSTVGWNWQEDIWLVNWLLLLLLFGSVSFSRSQPRTPTAIVGRCYRWHSCNIGGQKALKFSVNYSLSVSVIVVCLTITES